MKVCIVQPGLPTVSETFLQAQADRLSGNSTIVHGIRPRIAGKMSAADRAHRLWLRATRKLRGHIESWEVTNLYARALRAVNPDVVLAQYGITGARATEACHQLGVPLVVCFYGYDASNRETLEQYRNEYAKMFEYASSIVAVSKAMCSNLVEFGAPAEKLHYNPVSVQFAETQAQPANSPPVLLAVGRFVEKKAPHLTILAFSEVAREFPDARLRMVGDGPLLGFCRELVTKLRLDDQVELLGSKDHAAVRDEYCRARAFVQHSVVAPCGDREGTPVAVIEAGAAGLPVVSTRHMGIPEVVDDGRTGLLVDERDIRGMAQHFRTVLADPALAGRIGATAREHVRANFTLEISLARLVEILETSAGETATSHAVHRQSRAA